MKFYKLVEMYGYDLEITAEQLHMLALECNMWDGSFDGVIAHDDEYMDEILQGVVETDGVYTLLNMVAFGNYNPSDEWIRFDGYGNIETLSDYEYHKELMDYKDEIIDMAADLESANNIDLDHIGIEW